MIEIIKKMQKVLGNYETSKIKINIFPDEIWIDIYESEIPIIINKNNKDVYVDCEAIDNHLTSDMLNELWQITKIIEDNIDEFLKLVN